MPPPDGMMTVPEYMINPKFSEVEITPHFCGKQDTE